MKSKGLIEGALLVSIYIVLLLISLFTPLFIALLLLPLPFTIYAVRHGWRQGMTMALAAVLLSLIIWMPSVLLTLMMVSIGITMGELYHRGKRAYIAFAGGTLAAMGSQILILLLTMFIFGFNLVAEFQKLLEEGMELALPMLGSAGLEENVELFQQLITTMSLMLPFMLILSSAQFALLNHWLTRKVAVRLGMELPAFPPLHTWRLPTSIIWYYLIVLVLFMLIPLEKGGMLELILLNAYPLLQLLLVIQGFSFLAFLGQRKGWPKQWIVPVVIISLLFPILFQLEVLVGIADLGFPIRAYFANRG